MQTFLREVRLSLALFGVAWTCPASAESGNCQSVLPTLGPVVSSKHLVTAEDIARLRDIGVHDLGFPDAKPLALSPDGQRLAFQIRQGDPQTNRYCLAMVVIHLGAGSKPIVVDQGGDFISLPFEFWGKANFPSGNPKPIEPRWSPDGKWIAFLKRDGDVTQVWRADATGIWSAPLTHSDVDVEDFRISSDGESITFSSRPRLRIAREAIDREGLSGFKYDDRFSPMSSNRPFPAAPVPLEFFHQGLHVPDVRAASADEVATFVSPDRTGGGSAALDQNRSGRRVWLQPVAGSFPQVSELYAEADGHKVKCEAAACKGRVSKPWWTVDGTRIRFFRREGWALSATAIYEWKPGEHDARRLMVTDDILAGCINRGSELVCLREGSTFPRRIVKLDPATSTSKSIFEPNPEFSALSLGRVERMRWKNVYGIEAFGDLVLPVEYKPGTRYPLIIVQYESRGFLRGGTGDEYPIQAFASRGYAVFSFARPQNIGMLRGAKNPIENERINVEGFVDRKSVLSSLDIALQALIDRGIVDPQRVGITGLSDGVSTVQYALIHSRRFAAAALSHGSWEEAFPTAVGPAAMRSYSAAGYPGLTQDSGRFWREFALRPNAKSICIPILMQIPDDEFSSALEGFTALREAGVATELFVFPGEHHIKWQPAHRLAIYRRGLDWFDYWLRGIRSTSLDRQSELADWDALKAQRERLPSARSSSGDSARQ